MAEITIDAINRPRKLALLGDGRLRAITDYVDDGGDSVNLEHATAAIIKIASDCWARIELEDYPEKGYLHA